MTNQHREYERLIAPIEDRMIRSVWRIIRDPHDAEDAFQDALLTIWKRWDRIRSHPNPHALVFEICIHAAYDALRRNARRRRWQGSDALPEDIKDTSPSAMQGIASAQQHAEVFRAIGLLPKNQARAILMHAVEEMPYSEIAAALDCHEVTVRTHVARARAKLRTVLSRFIPPIHKEEGSHA